MKKFFGISLFAVAVVVIFIISCTKKSSHQSETSLQPTAKGMDTITSLEQLTKDSAIWKHHGMFTKVTIVPALEEEKEGPEDINSTCPDPFSGSARKAAKTSYYSGSYTTYSSVSTLRSALATDVTMRALGLTTSSARVSQEDNNANFTTAYVYAITRESDEDFHIIVGSSASSHTASNLLNTEVSGLPATSASSYSAIKATRDSVTSYFGKTFCGSSYTIFSPPIKLKLLKGSTFYDIDHAPGTVGPSGYQAGTSWEVHPIHDISF